MVKRYVKARYYGCSNAYVYVKVRCYYCAKKKLEEEDKNIGRVAEESIDYKVVVPEHEEMTMDKIEVEVDEKIEVVENEKENYGKEKCGDAGCHSL